MKLAIINGSPRGKSSNSNRLSDWICGSMDENTEVTKVFASEVRKHNELVITISGCDYFLFIFPLYTDAMPGVLKAFMEKMEAEKSSFSEKPVSFIVHSGFPESSQSITVERYTKLFASIMGMKYISGVRMGGSEALQVAPDNFFGKKKEAFETLGRNIENGKPFDSDSVALLSKTRKFNGLVKFLINHTNLNDMYFINRLKKNGVHKDLYARPYQK